MIRFNKKLYYKYFDLFRMTSFLRDLHEEKRSYTAMLIIKEADIKGFNLTDIEKIHHFNFDEVTKNEIILFRETGTIPFIDKYSNNIESWIKYIILPDFFNLESLSNIFNANNIRSKEELLSYFASSNSKKLFGEEKSELFYHFIDCSDGSTFPTKYSLRYSKNEILENIYSGFSIKGNFHNHTIYSDGIYSLKELLDIATFHEREYIGISDHTKEMAGLTYESIKEQHNIIDLLNLESGCKVLKSTECEILSNGDLDLEKECLDNLDYTIIGIHKHTNQIKSIAEKRLIKAIENPYSNILAHPSARLYKRKVELCVDMHKIIDACIANSVAIEINGDPDWLDLDPQYLSYAINKGAMFTLDSDTHLENSYKNINNAIQIAKDAQLPPEQCLNIKILDEVQTFFHK